MMAGRLSVWANARIANFFKSSFGGPIICTALNWFDIDLTLLIKVKTLFLFCFVFSVATAFKVRIIHFVHRKVERLPNFAIFFHKQDSWKT